jgi:hypothetical protein
MTFCQECARPWGVLLERGEEPTPQRIEEARAELIELLMTEHWEADYNADELARVDVTTFPKVFASRVVFISESLARFVDEHGLGESYADECWVEEDWVDIPGWLLKGRKHRWALRWDCCDIGNPEAHYASSELVAAARVFPQPQEAGGLVNRNE